jgi:uncharacterized protein YihD (DUF1040 family)
MEENTTLWVRKTTKERIQSYMKPNQTVDEFINQLLDQAYSTQQRDDIIQTLQQVTKQSGKQIDNWLIFHTEMDEQQFQQLLQTLPKNAILSFDGMQHTIALLTKTH